MISSLEVPPLNLIRSLRLLLSGLCHLTNYRDFGRGDTKISGFSNLYLYLHTWKVPTYHRGSSNDVNAMMRMVKTVRKETVKDKGS